MAQLSDGAYLSMAHVSSTRVLVINCTEHKFGSLAEPPLLWVVLGKDTK